MPRERRSRKAFGARQGLGITAIVRTMRYETVYTLTVGSVRSVGALGYWGGAAPLSPGDRVIVTRRADSRMWNIEGKALTEDSGTGVQGSSSAFSTETPTNWQSDRVLPTTTNEALEFLASRLKALELGTGQQEIVARTPFV